MVEMGSRIGIRAGVGMAVAVLDLRRRHVPPERLALPTESIPGNAPKVFVEIFTTGVLSQANGDYSITTN